MSSILNSRLAPIQADENDDEQSERASLMAASSARSTPAAASTTASQSQFDLDDNDEDWEDISLPSSTLKDRCIYWIFWTVPVLVYDALRLALFVLFLAPAFVHFFYYYITADRQVVRYKEGEGSSIRNTLDVYGATTNTKKDSHRKPVLVFFTGGAWVIGYKMWGAFLAKVFAAMGVLVVIPDYPNYPLATVPQMVGDAEAAIQWTLNEIESYGGDPNRVMLAGQSAGGHLCSVVLLQKALQILQSGNKCSGFQPTDLAGFCNISAPNDVQAMATNFQKHGLDQFFIQSLFGVRDNRSVRMDDYDPQRIVEQLERLVAERENPEDMGLFSFSNEAPRSTTLNQMLPPMSIFHGTADKTVPFEVSERFASSLQQIGITSEYIQYDGWSHTDPILEGIMDSDHRFHADLYDRLYKWTANKSNSKNRGLMVRHLDESIPECRKLCPSPLIRAARFVNPF